MFGNLFNKDYSAQGELKSLSISSLLDIIDIPIYNVGQLGLKKFLNDFITSPIVYTAITRITDNIASINPKVFDKKKNEFLLRHDLTDLINKKPNPFEDPSEFKTSLSSFYLLAGNSFTNAVGRFADISGKKPLLELQSLNPRDVTPQSTDTSGFVTKYQYTTGNITIIYNYEILAQKYLDDKGNELLHMKTFNPRGSSNNFLGVTALQPLNLEVEQYLQASVHNLSVIKNQGRPSAIVTSDSKEGSIELSTEQLEEIKARFTEIKGAQNAGKINFLPFNLKWQAISESVKDMDFDKLKNATEQAVYKAFKIPLTFASNEAGTFNNKESDKLSLYDDAVMPLVKRMYSFLGKKLLPRYPDSENLELCVDENEISVLARRKVDVANEKKKLGALSINELRTEIGKEAIGTEGNIIYQPSNLLPIGTDQFTSDNRETPAKKKERDIPYEKAYFRDMLIKQGYDKDYINKCLKGQYE